MSKDKLKILLMHSSNGREAEDFLQSQLTDFRERENVELVFQFVSWNNSFNTIIEEFKNGNYPDVIQLGSSWIGPLVHLKYIQPIEEDVNVREALPGWLNEACIYNGKRIAVPWTVDTMIMAIAKDVMKELNIEPENIRSWEGFYQEIKRLAELKEKDKTSLKPLIFAIRPEMETIHRLSAFLFAAGYNYPELDKSLDNFLANEEFFSVVKYLADLLKAAELSSYDVDTHPYKINENFYIYGTYVFYMGNWMGAVSHLLSHGYESKYKILPLPSREGSFGTFSGSSVLAVTSRTNYPGKSARLLEELISRHFLEKWQGYTSAIPAFESNFWQQRHSNDEVKTLYKMIVNSTSYPVHPVWRNIEKILFNNLSHCFWQLYIESELPLEERIYSILEESDQHIKTLLNMAWELE
ncbi:MAG: extracellular solute-binding protein [Halanaerobiales bacterium]